MALKEWSEYVGHFSSTVLNDKTIPADHSSKQHLKTTLVAHSMITTALTAYDKAAAEFKTTTDLAGRQKLLQEMVDSESNFTKAFRELENDFLHKLNPAGKTFSKSFMTHSGNLTNHKMKMIGAMHEDEATARKAIDVLKAGAPERPKTAAPTH